MIENFLVIFIGPNVFIVFYLIHRVFFSIHDMTKLSNQNVCDFQNESKVTV